MSLKSPRAISPVSRVRVGALAATTALALALAAAPAGLAQVSAPAAPVIVQLPTLAPLVKKVLPAVVNVSVQMKAGAPEADEEQDQDQDQNQDQDQDQGPQAGPGPAPQPGMPQSPFDEFLRRFFHQGPGGGAPTDPRAQRMALGSGFIVDPAGYIVTNNHVVENADKVTVIFQDDSKLTAKVVGRDDKTDLALLKIDAPKPLPYVEWGDSNAVQVGDWVLAVGNPFGLGGTVSSGIISARGRDIHEGPYDDFLQIDASINRGNSGGPTFNLDGKVIGINTAIYSPNGGSVGIGFAIPSSLAQPVIDQFEGAWQGPARLARRADPGGDAGAREEPGLAEARRRARRRRDAGRPGAEDRHQAGRRDHVVRRARRRQAARPAARRRRDAGR